MKKGKTVTKAKPSTGKRQITDKGLPPSYYRGQDKKTKPAKDKDGYIIPE